jgi:NAD(P)-dependent dehydrogenase (short-subunit alcohol dehydrogenase family)
MSGTRLAGKVALVSGAGSGIGRQVALRFASEGAQVIATSRTAEHVSETCELIQAQTGREPVGYVLDLRNRDQLDRVLKQVAAQFGGIDVLSCNAGVEDPREPAVIDTPDETWDETFVVNVTGVFWLCRAAIPLLADGGSIVTVGSANAVVPRANAAAYCSSKAALLMLTRALALELAPRRIRANCVCPGVVDTPLTDLFLSRAEDPDSMRAEYAASNPLQRIASADEIANCVLFLASDESSFVTGAPLIADGGALAT